MKRMNRITAEQFCSHIAEDDFFRRFGNPVFIINEEEPELVCMAWISSMSLGHSKAFVTI